MRDLGALLAGQENLWQPSETFVSVVSLLSSSLMKAYHQNITQFATVCFTLIRAHLTSFVNPSHPVFLLPFS